MRTVTVRPYSRCSGVALMSMVILSMMARDAVSSGRRAAVFVDVGVGIESVVLRGVEIENSFVAPLDDQTDELYDWTDVDVTGVVAPVGRMVHYRGNGMALTLGTGVKISGLQLGVETTILNAVFEGYSKRYMYQPDMMRAGGRSLRDKGHIPMYRVMGTIRYGILLRHLNLGFQTRIGGLIAGDTALIVGRAADGGAAFAADTGVEVSFRPSKWFSVGMLGYGGMFVFVGRYAGQTGINWGGTFKSSFYF